MFVYMLNETDHPNEITFIYYVKCFLLSAWRKRTNWKQTKQKQKQKEERFDYSELNKKRLNNKRMQTNEECNK